MNEDYYNNDYYGNFDEDLYKAGINITEVLQTVLPNNSIIYTISYEFLAQYSDGQRWVKDTALYGGGGLSLKDFKKRLLQAVTSARETLRHTKLNGEEA
jgi:hypothetical protein